MDKGQNRLYRDSRWKDCRRRILQRDNYTCCRCGQSKDETKLQVHHLHYYQGKKPWEYPDVELITLCKGCHAEEHGYVMPQSGWEYCGESDLEDLIGTCEVCGSQIRYEHSIYHADWGYLNVGCQCADRLTGNSYASETEKKRRDLANKFRTFRKSPRWNHKGNRYYRTFKDYNITIWDNKTHFRLDVGFSYHDEDKMQRWDKLHSKKKYPSLEEAEYAVFNAIVSGKVQEYIDKHFNPEC